MTEEHNFLTTDDCAHLIRRSPGAIRNLVLRRAIPFRKRGRLIFLRNEIEEWITEAPGLRLTELENK